MRSFMKSHRRGSSSNIGEGYIPELSTGTSDNSDTIPQSDERRYSSPSANSSAQSSPVRQSPSSPIVNKGKKLHRLFLRNKNSSPNLVNLANGMSSPFSPKKSPPPSIIGTKTHEWGNSSNDSHKGFGKSSNNRRSAQSSQSSTANSLYSLEDQNFLSSTSTQNKDTNPQSSAGTIDDHEHQLQLPLNTVLELPNENSLSPFMREIPDSAALDKKTRHRRAQIISADSFKLEDPPDIIPGYNFQREREIPSPELFNDGFVDPDETVAESIQNQKLREKQLNEEEVEDQELHGDAVSSSGSEFSFEQDNRKGRNVSIKYYKSPEEYKAEQAQMVQEQGFYVNDLVDDNFDEDMNYYDEFDDEFNDDEELFNRKYFSDDEDEIIPKKRQPSIVNKHMEQEKLTPQGSINDQASKKLTPASSILSSNKDLTPENSFTNHKNWLLNHSNSQLKPHFSPKDDLLRPRKSLKYHQISTTLDQDVPQNRYSWFSDDEDSRRPLDGGNSSYDSLLDEINNIPEDFEFENKEEEPHHQLSQSSRSRSMNSSMKRNKGVFEDSPQNTKFESNNKTVTLFNRPSRQSSLKSNGSGGEISQQQQQFGYLTPNGSFTLPNPGFANQNNELSPITEGSIDGSP